MFDCHRIAVSACGLLLALAGCDQVFGLDRGPDEPPRLRDLVMSEVATELVVDGEDLFWLTADEIRSCQLAACSPRTLLAGLAMPVALRVVGDQVQYAEATEVYRVPRIGGAQSLVVPATGNGRSVTSFLQLQNHLYFTHDRISRCNYDPAGICGATSVMFDEIVGPIVADPSQRIWGGGTSAGQSGVYVINAADTTAAQLQLVSTSAAPVRAIAASAPRVFAIQTTTADVLEWPAAAAPDTQPAVAMFVTAPSVIAVDASTVWVASAEGEVWRRRLVGGPETTVLVFKDSVVIRALAVGTDEAIVALDDRIAAFDVPAL
ncbi:MAG: hypothetical protein ACKV2T_33245 [Kofleriaceae bacterium]